MRTREEMSSQVVGALVSMAQFDEIVAKGLIEFGAGFAIVTVVSMVISENASVPVIGAVYGLIIACLHAVFEKQHFNPFFTIQAFLHDVFDGAAQGVYFATGFIQMILIIGAQIAGSVAGAQSVKWARGNSQAVGATVPAMNVPMGDVVYYEFTYSFAYAIFIYVLSSKVRLEAVESSLDKIKVVIIQHVVIPMVSGAIIFIATTAIYPYTGASVNPLRTIGPALISGQYYGIGYIFLGQTCGYLGASILFNVRQAVKKIAYTKTSSS